jgi:prevent-host-death family protein
MPDIGACDARTHLPKLLERVQRGERFVITMHGRPIAELVPVATRDSAPACDVVAGKRERRRALADRGVHLGDVLQPGESLRELAHSGHRTQLVGCMRR